MRVCILLLLALGAAPVSAAEGADGPELGLRLERWFNAQGHVRLRSDPALVAAALENSRAVAELDGGERLGVDGYLQFLLERHQVRDAVVLALSGRFSDPTRLWRRILDYLGERLPGAEVTHYGLGLAPLMQARRPEGRAELKGGVAATLILVRRRVELGSVRAVSGQLLELCGAVVGRGELRVLATTPKGRVLEARPRRHGARFCASLGRAARGRYQLELMVDGAFGPEVAALFPLWVGEEPPSLPVQKLYPPAARGREAAEQELFALLQQTRRRAGLPPLARSPALQRAARRHSLEMVQRGFFGHRSPRRGDLARRLAEEQLPYLQASENLALSSSPQRAHDALLASPAHRRNLLDPALTHAGIGVAVDPARGLLYITQCFARLAEP